MRTKAGAWTTVTPSYLSCSLTSQLNSLSTFQLNKLLCCCLGAAWAGRRLPQLHLEALVKKEGSDEEVLVQFKASLLLHYDGWTRRTYRTEGEHVNQREKYRVFIMSQDGDEREAGGSMVINELAAGSDVWVSTDGSVIARSVGEDGWP
jgi:type VI protein secretion system component VasF